MRPIILEGSECQFWYSIFQAVGDERDLRQCHEADHEQTSLLDPVCRIASADTEKARHKVGWDRQQLSGGVAVTQPGDNGWHE